MLYLNLSLLWPTWEENGSPEDQDGPEPVHQREGILDIIGGNLDSGTYQVIRFLLLS